MRRRLIVWTTLLVTVLAVAAPAYLVTAAPGSIEQEKEPIVHRGSTACGVERWSVKTGMDHDASKVNTKAIAKLLRVKQEADSDYHLVLSDTGGRTMIAEIPSPSCIGSSPFLPSIRYVRSKFSAAYHPSESWRRLNVTVHVTGVGFFDFIHGQSGVAPNGIELHPAVSSAVGLCEDLGSQPSRSEASRARGSAIRRCV